MTENRQMGRTGHSQHKTIRWKLFVLFVEMGCVIERFYVTLLYLVICIQLSSLILLLSYFQQCMLEGEQFKHQKKMRKSDSHQTYVSPGIKSLFHFLIELVYYVLQKWFSKSVAIPFCYHSTTNAAKSKFNSIQAYRKVFLWSYYIAVCVWARNFM